MLRVTKYDGAVHWVQLLSVVSDDGSLLTARYSAGTPIFTSRGEFRSRYDSQVYFWRDRWYNVFCLSEPGKSTALWYCNVTTPPTLDEGRLSYVDLDLDLAVRAGGSIELLDGDEFEEHKEKYGYPPSIVERAKAALGELSTLALRQQFPFDSI